ncbi:50S ribosomal protein L35 [Synergistales bacterium]|nr:50S ribosomal protein L35 [Synergistales bacterium]
MPKQKLKSHSGAKKRFSYTATGRLAYRKVGRRHIMVGKGAKRERRMRQTGYVSPTLMEQLKRMLPYA